MKVFAINPHIYSPLGTNSAENFASVLAGKTGLSAEQFRFSEKPLWVSRLDTEQLENNFRMNTKTTFSKLEKMCLISMMAVINQTNLHEHLAETALVFCSTKGNIDALNENPEQISIPRLAQKLADFVGIPYKPYIISNACISGLQGIIWGKRLIKSGNFKYVLVVAGDLVSDFVLSGFKSFNAVSDEPCRPFDSDRKGINLGEASASILLTSDENLLSYHSANEVVDGFVSNDATHISAPSRTGEGLYKVIKQLQEKYPEKPIDCISAHGTATIYNDEMESYAFTRAGLADVPLYSLKGYFGHTLGTAGLLESNILLQSMQGNTVPVSKGFQTNGTANCLNINTINSTKPLKNALKTASGFGGCNAAVLFSKIE
jgi:3-oxoacyl-[acyl-carrier-protein] synthase I